MAFSLSSGEKTQLQAFTDQLKSLEQVIAERITEYNSIIDEAQDFINDRSIKFREQYEEKDESWQESETGSEADEFVSEWEELDLKSEKVDDVEFSDAVENLENLSVAASNE